MVTRRSTCEGGGYGAASHQVPVFSGRTGQQTGKA
jgi:hypothetical protein